VIDQGERVFSELRAEGCTMSDQYSNVSGGWSSFEIEVRVSQGWVICLSIICLIVRGNGLIVVVC